MRSDEEQKLKNIVTMRVNLLRMFELAKMVIEEFQMGPDLSDDDVVFCNDYWVYLNTIQQIVDRFQEVKGDVTTLSDKVSTNLKLMSFDVKFVEDSIPRDIELVKTEVRNLLQGLIQTEDINSFKTSSHLRHMLKAHVWKLEMQGIVVEVDNVVARNKAKVVGMLRGLELTSKFLDNEFKD